MDPSFFLFIQIWLKNRNNSVNMLPFALWNTRKRCRMKIGRRNRVQRRWLIGGLFFSPPALRIQARKRGKSCVWEEGFTSIVTFSRFQYTVKQHRVKWKIAFRGVVCSLVTMGKNLASLWRRGFEPRCLNEAFSYATYWNNNASKDLFINKSYVFWHLLFLCRMSL